MNSKSFRAELPALDQQELERLRRWGLENCAESILYRQGASVMWLVTRERARTREDFVRAVRSTLRKLSIDTSNLRKGHWITLTCNEVVKAEGSSICRPAPEAMPTGSAGGDTVNIPRGDGDDKIITLNSPGPGSGAPLPLVIIKEQ